MSYPLCGGKHTRADYRPSTVDRRNSPSYVRQRTDSTLILCLDINAAYFPGIGIPLANTGLVDTRGCVMRVCVALILLLFGDMGIAQMPVQGGTRHEAAYPESEAAEAWRGLAASYVRKALRDQKLDKDPVLNGRIDAVMAAVGAAAGAIDARFAGSAWRAILIEDFGRGAVAFPGETILVDARFVRNLALSDAELALILSHEAAHVIAGHALAKLSFMAEILGKDKIPTARTALLEFLAKDSYAEVFQPKAQLQEREADSVGAVILFASGYDPQRALTLFDKLTELEVLDRGRAERSTDSHDSASVRKQTVAAVIDELQQLHARRGADPR
jgi:Zn-dependent protease with chaperone function